MLSSVEEMDCSGIVILLFSKEIGRPGLAHALEAEPLASVKGLEYVLPWMMLSSVEETNCSDIVILLLSKEMDRSSLAWVLVVENIEIILQKVHRSQNRINHELANML
uniref:RNase H type-1 domain-containing protein n=1 Tax=Leersia perrieri TaxID=77586 RepID=A0A0D9WTF7_9ORYZ